MTVKYATCEGCSQHKLTGYLACAKQQLCSQCAAGKLGVTDKTIIALQEEVLKKELASACN